MSVSPRQTIVCFARLRRAATLSGARPRLRCEELGHSRRLGSPRLPLSAARFLAVASVVALSGAVSGRPALAQPPTFRSSVDVVSVTAIARDDRGRPVKDLGRDDFEIYEQGQLRRLTDFRVSDQGPVSLAILMDASGSMRVGAQLDAGRRAVEHILSWVQPAADEVSLFSFDRELRQEVPFTKDLEAVRSGLYKVEALGLTSLYDAIGRTARTLADRPSPRRAVIVITDGLDTSSALSAGEVSGLASAIDVPVYVIAVLSPLDHPGQDHAVVGAESSPVATHLSNLSYWTGGTLFMVSAPTHASQAARDLITELRHQYLIAFEAAREPGWYELDVRTRRRELTVRARSGYFSQSRQG
jgi:Ca-activated chloride channel family protein